MFLPWGGIKSSENHGQADLSPLNCSRCAPTARIPNPSSLTTNPRPDRDLLTGPAPARFNRGHHRSTPCPNVLAQQHPLPARLNTFKATVTAATHQRRLITPTPRRQSAKRSVSGASTPVLSFSSRTTYPPANCTVQRPRLGPAQLTPNPRHSYYSFRSYLLGSWIRLSVITPNLTSSRHSFPPRMDPDPLSAWSLLAQRGLGHQMYMLNGSHFTTTTSSNFTTFLQQ